MAKLRFYYSAMNAGKTTLLLQSDFNYRERGMTTLCFLPQVVAIFQPLIQSRMGLSKTPVILGHTMDMFAHVAAFVRGRALACVLIDEAQFLTRTQVQAACRVVDELDIPVLAFGLRTDFQGELFEGSRHLLAVADEMQELKTICFCGKKSTMTARIGENGRAETSGEQIECGGNERYVALCRKHHRQFCAGQLSPEVIVGGLAPESPDLSPLPLHHPA